MKPIKKAVIKRSLHIPRKEFEIISNIRYVFMLEKKVKIRIGAFDDIHNFFKLRKKISNQS